MRAVAVDTGGTFTDVVLATRRGLQTFKLLSTPKDPSRAVQAGVDALAEGQAIDHIVHGSTVATNALLERRGARTALITTAGFEDILLIGRQTRPQLYNLCVDKPPPLIPRRLVFGLDERLAADGSVIRPLQERDLHALGVWLRRKKPASVAVCLLHAYANPSHEEQVARVLESLEVPYSLSSRVHPEFREFERTSTTAINAYVMPNMRAYLGELDRALPTKRLSVMQSNGGRLRADRAQAEPVHTILSGPAGGVVGAFAVAREAGFHRIVTFDMGGTSTDVALCDGEIPLATGTVVDGLPVSVPMIDIHTVGAGGGSIAALDVGGALRVGPQSAGADPGPMCYGKGNALTVTDAHVYLGRIDPDRFLGGRMRLDAARIERPLGELARRATVTPTRLAEGILTVANVNMERAIRVISVERGYDPRDFVLVAFGGAGGLHACDLVRALGFRRAIVPCNPGLLSAYGMLCADNVWDCGRSILLPYADFTPARQTRLYAPLERTARESMRAEGFGPRQYLLERLADMRYVGQSYELTVPAKGNMGRAFHALHRQRYGHADPRRALEVATIRVRARRRVTPPRLGPPPTRRRVPKPDPVAERRMIFDGKACTAGLYSREALAAGHAVDGPAVITEMSATTVVPPDFTCHVDATGNLRLARK